MGSFLFYEKKFTKLFCKTIFPIGNFFSPFVKYNWKFLGRIQLPTCMRLPLLMRLDPQRASQIRDCISLCFRVCNVLMKITVALELFQYVIFTEIH